MIPDWVTIPATVNDKLCLPILQRGRNDPREAPGPVVAVLRQQTHCSAIALDAQAIAVVFIICVLLLAITVLIAIGAW
jgi:hypothetical protein